MAGKFMASVTEEGRRVTLRHVDGGEIIVVHEMVGSAPLVVELREHGYVISDVDIQGRRVLEHRHTENLDSEIESVMATALLQYYEVQAAVNAVEDPDAITKEHLALA